MPPSEIVPARTSWSLKSGGVNVIMENNFKLDFNIEENVIKGKIDGAIETCTKSDPGCLDALLKQAAYKGMSPIVIVTHYSLDV